MATRGQEANSRKTEEEPQMINTTEAGNKQAAKEEDSESDEDSEYDPEAQNLGYDSGEEEAEPVKGPVVINLSEQVCPGAPASETLIPSEVLATKVK